MEHGDLVKRLRKQAAIHSASMRIGAICKAASGQAMSEAADALEAAQAENAKLRAAIERQAAAVRTLHHNEQTEINVLRSKQTEAHRAVATLDSEREMNALLTEENEAAQARIAALEAELAVVREALGEVFADNDAVKRLSWIDRAAGALEGHPHHDQ